MILPFVCSYLIGRFVSKKTLGVTIGILVGVALGLSATSAFIPLLYPIFIGETGLVVIPEYKSIGIMILIPDFIIYTETVSIFTRPYLIDFVFVLIGIFFSVFGTWYGSAHRLEKNTGVFKQV
ncbi:MAG: hypothetical protein ACFFCX_09320 [Candidatus Sifarchaeia archaeon]